MATYTENYGLVRPGYEDPVDIAVVNRNMDAIDTELARNADGEARLSIVTNLQILALFEEGEE